MESKGEKTKVSSIGTSINEQQFAKGVQWLERNIITFKMNHNAIKVSRFIIYLLLIIIIIFSFFLTREGGGKGRDEKNEI